MADVSDKKLAEFILQQLLVGAAVNGLRFGVLQLLFDTQEVNGEPYITLASAWVLYPARPETFPENETDAEEFSMEEEILFAVSLRHKVVSSVEILEPWPHLVLTFTDNSVLYLNGKNIKYELWPTGLNGVPTDENIQIIACPGGGLAFFLPPSLSANPSFKRDALKRAP